jgi:hypothetical protein
MFRFTIHELCLAIAVVSLALAWWMDHRVMAHQLEEQRHDFRELKFRYNDLGAKIFG